MQLLSPSLKSLYLPYLQKTWVAPSGSEEAPLLRRGRWPRALTLQTARMRTPLVPPSRSERRWSPGRDLSKSVEWTRRTSLERTPECCLRGQMASQSGDVRAPAPGGLSAAVNKVNKVESKAAHTPHCSSLIFSEMKEWFEMPCHENGCSPWEWTSAGNPGPRCSRCHGARSWTPGTCRPPRQSKCDPRASRQTGPCRWLQSDNEWRFSTCGHHTLTLPNTADTTHTSRN